MNTAMKITKMFEYGLIVIGAFLLGVVLLLPCFDNDKKVSFSLQVFSDIAIIFKHFPVTELHLKVIKIVILEKSTFP